MTEHFMLLTDFKPTYPSVTYIIEPVVTCLRPTQDCRLFPLALCEALRAAEQYKRYHGRQNVKTSVSKWVAVCSLTRLVQWPLL